MQASCRYESSSGTIYVQTRRSGPWNDGAVIPDQHSDQTRPARGEIYVRRFAHEKRVVLLREREVSISCFQAFCDWFSEFVLIKFMLELRFVLSFSGPSFSIHHDSSQVIAVLPQRILILAS